MGSTAPVTTHHSAPARPYTLPFGLLFGPTLRIFVRNLVPFTLLGALVLSPWVVLLLFGPELFDLSLEAQRVAYAVAVGVLPMALSPILTGALSFGVVRQMHGQPASVWLVFAKGFQSCLRALLTGVLVLLRVVLFGLLALAPVLLATERLLPWVPAMLLAFVLALPALVEYLRLYVALAVAVVEPRGVGFAIRRSKELTFGSKQSILVGVLAGAWLMGALGFLLDFVVGLLSDDDVSMHRVTMAVLQVLGAGLGATMMAVCYVQLRRGKENVDPAALAAVFD